MDIKFVSELDKLLIKPKKIVIIPHRNPDGDALGSSLALKHYLEKKGHQASVISPNASLIPIGMITDNTRIAKRKPCKRSGTFA